MIVDIVYLKKAGGSLPTSINIYINIFLFFNKIYTRLVFFKFNIWIKCRYRTIPVFTFASYKSNDVTLIVNLIRCQPVIILKTATNEKDGRWISACSYIVNSKTLRAEKHLKRFITEVHSANNSFALLCVALGIWGPWDAGTLTNLPMGTYWEMEGTPLVFA